ncbi:hypothetical protein CYLTODRAFT_378887 [Cylindrobasidium torrendii FP15055 ss-10]|uniref:Chromo domain-containing protein n=1 Tax=Cylindrobasidium torrendii FP15055 ss-10 TaxID=1314674 RepID=A0A0D7B5F8_9AGAR|nr:hypothetical protein CYLTODRAFT_378887 [Cylindrobasidium torrendii FP15055 ss-10]
MSNVKEEIEEPSLDGLVPAVTAPKKAVGKRSSKKRRRSPSKEPEDDPLAMYRNPKVKVKKDGFAGLNADTVLARLDAIGREFYPDVPPCSNDFDIYKQFSREYFASQFGGSIQATVSQPGEGFLERHPGVPLRSFMALHLDWNPHAPQLPGAPGLFFGGCTSGEKFTTMVRLNSGNWMYVGEYEMQPSAHLTLDEWRAQEHAVKISWCKGVLKYGWGWKTRAAIVLKKELGREATRAELDAAGRAGRSFDGEVTVEEVKYRYDQGDSRIGVCTMKCFDYDADIQRTVINEEKYAEHLVEKERKAAEKKNKAGKSNGKKTNGARSKTKKPSVKAKVKGQARGRKRPQDGSNEDENEDEDEDENFSVHSDSDGDARPKRVLLRSKSPQRPRRQNPARGARKSTQVQDVDVDEGIDEPGPSRRPRQVSIDIPFLYEERRARSAEDDNELPPEMPEPPVERRQGTQTPDDPANIEVARPPASQEGSTDEGGEYVVPAAVDELDIKPVVDENSTPDGDEDILPEENSTDWAVNMCDQEDSTDQPLRGDGIVTEESTTEGCDSKDWVKDINMEESAPDAMSNLTDLDEDEDVGESEGSDAQENEESAEEFTVERIVGERKLADGSVWYHVKWKDWPLDNKDWSWLSEETASQLEAMDLWESQKASRETQRRARKRRRLT